MLPFTRSQLRVLPFCHEFDFLKLYKRYIEILLLYSSQFKEQHNVKNFETACATFEDKYFRAQVVVETLRSLFQLCVIYRKTHEKKMEYSTLNYHTNQLCKCLYVLLVGHTHNGSFSRRIRVLSSVLLREISNGTLPIHFSHNFRGDFSYYNLGKCKKGQSELSSYLSILFQLSSPKMLRINCHNLCKWLTEEQATIRHAVLPAVFKAHRIGILSEDEEALVELWLARWLCSAELVSPRARNFGYEWRNKENSSHRHPISVIEPDDSPARNIFTALSGVLVGRARYTDRQLFNIHAFSIAHTWLRLQCRKLQNTKQNEELEMQDETFTKDDDSTIDTESYSEDEGNIDNDKHRDSSSVESIESSDDSFSCTMAYNENNEMASRICKCSAELTDALVTYCFRILDQVVDGSCKTGSLYNCSPCMDRISLREMNVPLGFGVADAQADKIDEQLVRRQWFKMLDQTNKGLSAENAYEQNNVNKNLRNDASITQQINRIKQAFDKGVANASVIGLSLGSGMTTSVLNARNLNNLSHLHRLRKDLQTSQEWHILHELLFEAATVESLRILNLLCRGDRPLVSRIFPTLRQFSLNEFDQHIPRTSSSHRYLTFLEIMQFFINHREVVIFNVEPLLHWLFCTYLSQHYYEPLVASQTIDFCLKNASTFLTHTNVFGRFFPSIIKLMSLHPGSSSSSDLRSQYKKLIPILTSPTSLVELLHLILDIPLVAGILEQRPLFNTNGQDKLRTTNSPDQLIVEDEALVSFLTRNKAISSNMTKCKESQCNDSEEFTENDPWVGCPWGPLFLKSCKTHKHFGESFEYKSNVDIQPVAMRRAGLRICAGLRLTPRVKAASSLVAALLDAYFAVLLKEGEHKDLLSAVRIIFRRFSVLFGPAGFRQRVRRVLLDRCIAAMHRFPRFIIDLKKDISNLFSSCKSSIVKSVGEHSDYKVDDSLELVIHVCWAVGEHSNPSLLGQYVNNNTSRGSRRVETDIKESQTVSDRKSIDDLHQILEVFVYEQISSIRWMEGLEYQSMSSKHVKSNAQSDSSIGKLLTVAVAALGKMAMHITDLTPRVLLCLSKVISLGNAVHPVVIQRASETTRLLLHPSISATLYSLPHPATSLSHEIPNPMRSSLMFRSYVDKNTPLSFLLPHSYKHTPHSDFPGANGKDASL